MHVRVLLFGMLREIAGSAEQELELPSASRMDDAFEALSRLSPPLAAFRPVVVASRNQEYAAWDAPLSEGDEVAFLPPVSGGAAVDTADESCELVHKAIPVAQRVAAIKAPEDGAVAVFEGIVRNHSGGKHTLHLEYEAYEPMAVEKMREIAAQAREKFAIHRITIIHRLGRMEIGETSVLIGVSAAHRAAAFDACRFAIDALKRVVPIWKKEFFADASEWAEGEMPSGSAAQPPRPRKPSNHTT